MSKRIKKHYFSLQIDLFRLFKEVYLLAVSDPTWDKSQRSTWAYISQRELETSLRSGIHPGDE